MKCLLGFHDFYSVTFKYGRWYECARCGHRADHMDEKPEVIGRAFIIVFLSLFVLYVLAHLVYAMWLRS